MIDINSFPADDPNVFIVKGSQSPSVTTEFWTWNKPRNCSFVYILQIGAGGGGGGGAGSGITRGGGGGGTSGNTVTVLLPSFAVPDRLYIRCPSGGGGGAGGAAGNGSAGSAAPINGGVYVYQNASAINAVAQPATSVGTAAGGGTNLGGGGTGGTVNTIAIATSFSHAQFGIFYAMTGSAGAAGGSALAGNSVRFTGTTGHSICAGAGGAGWTASNLAGGDILPEAMIDATLTPFLTSSGGNTSAGNANPGYIFGNFPKIYGGTGGGTGAKGGSCGTNAFGAGGGGGGAGSASSGFDGGSGGPGLVAIICW